MVARTAKKIRKDLCRILGTPRAMSERELLHIKAAFTGWYNTQMEPPRSGNPRIYSVENHDKLIGQRWLIRHGDRAVSRFHGEFREKFGNWSVEAIAKGSPMYDRPKRHWKTIETTSRKRVQIVIPVTWHLDVATKGIGSDGRKVVQRAWGHRDYGDKQIWNCYFWDFRKLSNDENSWNKCTYHEGYVAKCDSHVVVDTDLARALKTLGKRVVDEVADGVVLDHVTNEGQ